MNIEWPTIHENLLQKGRMKIKREMTIPVASTKTNYHHNEQTIMNLLNKTRKIIFEIVLVSFLYIVVFYSSSKSFFHSMKLFYMCRCLIGGFALFDVFYVTRIM